MECVAVPSRVVALYWFLRKKDGGNNFITLVLRDSSLRICVVSTFVQRALIHLMPARRVLARLCAGAFLLFPPPIVVLVAKNFGLR